MLFKVDKQTIGDLNLISGKGNDVFSLFNKTKTRGGADILKDMFMYPRSGKEEIASRVRTIQYFKDNEIGLPFDNAGLDTIEYYLSNTDERSLLSPEGDTLMHKLNKALGADTEYQEIQKGVEAVIAFFSQLLSFLAEITGKEDAEELSVNIKAMEQIVEDSKLDFLRKDIKSQKLTYTSIAEYDRLFRFQIRNEITKLLYYIYEVDVFVALAEISRKEGFVFAEIDEGKKNIIELEGVYHPLVPNAVSNDISIDESSNMIFLTGANMAGKSTFMKTFCIAMYLAHMGFPVPAKKMKFTPQNGMFTTINLSDNLNMGFSHFYAEVSRVKSVAESVNTNDRLIVVFDELFRGTNVKDAYEATVAVTNAFASKRKCTFIISTHIIEAGDELKKLRDNIKFVYLPTVMEGSVPKYTYKVTEGITSDRHGMIIIKNEGILDILKS